MPARVCVVCRKPYPRTTLIRLVRRPGGRIGWPNPIARETEPLADPSPRRGEKTKRLGARTPPSGKGLYVCRGGDCLARLMTEKRFKRMFVESMEEECVARLSASLRSQTPSSSNGPRAKIEGRDANE